MTESPRHIKPASVVRRTYGKASALIIIYLFTATVISYSAWALDGLLWNISGIAMDVQLYGILASILPTVCGAAAAILVARKLSGFQVKEILIPPHLRPGIILLGFGLCMGLNLAASYLTGLLTQWLNQGGVSATPPDFSYSSERPLLSGFLIFYACLIAPILEEIIFRGYILRLLQRFGNGFAILLSAILFGIYHFDLTQLLPAFAMGCLFGYLAISCDSIFPVIVIHTLNNIVAVCSSSLSSPIVLVIDIALCVFSFLSLVIAIFLKHRDHQKPRIADADRQLTRWKALGAAATSPIWILLLLVYFYQVIIQINPF